MKRSLVAIVVALAVSSALFACTGGTISDSTANRAKEADRYLVAVPPQEMVEDMASSLSQNLPEEQRETFKTTMIANFDTKAVGKAMREALLKNFTAAELKSLSDFYSSPTSRSAMKKYSGYMKDIMPAFQQE
ncbi:MAG: DUF2059 domain-containing protein, partial [Myxococcota bacterium]